MSFEANKIAASILVALIVAMVSGILAEKLVHPIMLAKNVYEIAGGAAEAAAPADAAPAGPEPIGPLLATASAATGKSDTKVCTACHTFDKGGRNLIGPNLYDVFGDPIAQGHDNYSFSTALTQAGAGKSWTPELLNEWLFKPQNFAHGSKMTFIGLPKAKDRADVISYLDSLSDSPKPLVDAGAGATPPAAAGAGTTPPAAASAAKTAPAPGGGGK
jgi:cytochrome c